MTDRVTVLIVDDHFLFASSLASLIKETDRFRLAGIAVTGPQALAMVREERPDIVLLDYHLPGYSADRLLPRLVAVSPATRVIVLTADTREAALIGSLRAGAIGFMTKDKAIDDVLDALSVVADGGTLLTPQQRDIAAAAAAVTLPRSEVEPAPATLPPSPEAPSSSAAATLPRSPGSSLGGPGAAAPGDPPVVVSPASRAVAGAPAEGSEAAPSTSPQPQPQSQQPQPQQQPQLQPQPQPQGQVHTPELQGRPPLPSPAPAHAAPAPPPAPASGPVELRLIGVGSFAQAVLIERFIDRLPQVERVYIRDLGDDRASLSVSLHPGASADGLAKELVDGSRRLRLMAAERGMLELQVETPLIDG